MENITGASCGPGSTRSAPEAPSGLRPSGDDPSRWLKLDELRSLIHARFAVRGQPTQWARGIGMTDEIILGFLRGARPPADDLLHALGYVREIHYRRVDPCTCYTCTRARCVADPIEGIDWRMASMFLCETCGNKRCPHGHDHRNACTNSNESGQPGSGYGPAQGIETRSAKTEGLGPQDESPVTKSCAQGPAA